MAQRGQSTGFEERMEIGERWETGQKDAEIAAAMMRSVWTIRKWRRKYQREGRSGLATRMERPATGALGQYPPKIRQAIVEPERAHEVWEADAQGVIKVPGLGSVSIINIKDLFSRLKVASYPCLHTSHPNTLDYQLVLRRAFVNWGLPERISLDHDSVFYDNASASPYPTILHLWLIALGIEVRFIQQKPPAEHSVIERSHQTVTQQAIAGQSFTHSLGLEKSLSDRLDFLNSRYPSLSLGGQPPLVAYPQAKLTQRPYRLEWEEEMLDMQRVYDYLSKGRWFRRTSKQGQFSLGAHPYNAKSPLSKQTLEITFDPQTRQFVCLSEDGKQKIRFLCRGLSKADLMGELNPFVILPAYQLELPFSRAAWREITLCNDLTGTTL